MLRQTSIIWKEHKNNYIKIFSRHILTLLLLSKKYNVSIKAIASTEESFRYTEQKFNVGMVTPVDYNAAKTQLLTAQSDMAQAKYEFMFKIKVLDFYKGLPLSLNQ